MNPCAKCGTQNFMAGQSALCYCEFCFKRLEQKIKDQTRTIEEHESYIQKQEMRILNLKTSNENTRALLEKELEEAKAELKTIKTNEGF